VRLDRMASAANEAFDELARGDVVTIAGTRFSPDGLRLQKETTVTRQR
jgi:hypothetical protein